MQTYGIILADNGGNWYISGTPDTRWNDNLLDGLTVLTGGDFEAVDESCLMVNDKSYQADLKRCVIKPPPGYDIYKPVGTGGELTVYNVWYSPTNTPYIVTFSVNSAGLWTIKSATIKTP
jgi:hypothetical protein